jgi:hypothetical protein
MKPSSTKSALSDAHSRHRLPAKRRACTRVLLMVCTALTLTACASVDKRPVPDGSELVPINGRVVASKPALALPPMEKL